MRGLWLFRIDLKPVTQNFDYDMSSKDGVLRTGTEFSTSRIIEIMTGNGLKRIIGNIRIERLLYVVYLTCLIE